MDAVILTPVRVPVPPGADQPHNERIYYDELTKALGLCFIKTSKEVRIMKGTDEGILKVAPPAASEMVQKTWTHGKKTVPSSGTRQTLTASSTQATHLIMQAKLVAGNNTGNVFWGDTLLEAGVNEGIELAPGESFEIKAAPGECFDLAAIFLDADNNDDGVVFMYLPA